MEALGQLPNMSCHLHRLLAQVPRGRVTTYGDLARALGNVMASRWVGYYLLHHDHNQDCQCHRVVRSNGDLGTHVSGSQREKSRCLDNEGVVVHSGRVDVQQFQFFNFVGQKPLEQLEQRQQAALEQLSLTVDIQPPERIGGVDVSYDTSTGHGVAAYAVVEIKSGKLIWSHQRHGRVAFPYIPSYLAFRELPLLLELIAEVRQVGQLTDVVMVDGSGILHPRRAGVATLLGIQANLPTIGITKKRLCGQVDLGSLETGTPAPVEYQNRIVAMALRNSNRSQRPIFISPGHRMDVATAVKWVQSVLYQRRLPAPIYWADRLSRKGVHGT